ncbi:MAG: hypothetical protein Sapg2KO_47160 [Saprospiraceae bacterium]
MGLILRVDVDKPYGHHQLWRKVLSKVAEDYFPKMPQLPGYLSHLRELVDYCNQNSVPGIFFHRLCTIPDRATRALLIKGRHEIGLHLENSRTMETALSEYKQFISLLPDLNVRYFSKHGSGTYKLGKYHEPSYKPNLYRKWSEHLPISLHSGNDILKSMTSIPEPAEFNSAIFWVEMDYREESLQSIDQAIELAQKRAVVVLIHPSNFVTDSETRNEFCLMVEKAKKSDVSWVKI